MLLSLMVYVITVSLLLALAAWAFEPAVRVFAFPTPWIWVGAMAGSVVLTLAVATVLVRAQLRLRSDRSTWTPAELDRRDVRMAGLILLSALLVVVSCEVERPPTGVPEASVVPADPPVVRVEPPTTQGEPAPSGVESIEDAIRTLRALDPAGGPVVRAADQAGDVAPSQAEPQEISPETRAAIQAGPVFTPMTVRPEIRNRQEVVAALMQEYPAALRNAGIGGTVVVWFLVTEEGTVPDTRVSRSSGQAQLDEAALRVATTLRFTPAKNGTEPVAVWIEVPITFQAR